MSPYDFKSNHLAALATPVTEMGDKFLAVGFKPADMVKDFGYEVKNCIYLYRNHQGQHQYLALVGAHDTGTFLEACFNVYDKAFNSRAKPAQVPLFGLLYRTLPEIEGAVNKVYELPKKKS